MTKKLTQQWEGEVYNSEWQRTVGEAEVSKWKAATGNEKPKCMTKMPMMVKTTGIISRCERLNESRNKTCR